MGKILLVFEDYTELMTMESTLKKVGFDVIGLTSEYSLSEQLIAFNPDVVVGYGHGGKVSSLGVGRRLKEATRWQGQSVLVFKAQQKPEPQDLLKVRSDLFLEAPITPRLMLQVLAKLLRLDEVILKEKMDRLGAIEAQQKNVQVSEKGRGGAASSDSVFVGGGDGQGTPDEDSGDGPLGGGLFSFKDKDPKSLYTDSDESESNSSESSAGSSAKLFDVDIQSLEAEVFNKKPIARSDLQKPGTPAPTVEELQKKANESMKGTGIPPVAFDVSAPANPLGEELPSLEALQKIREQLAEAKGQEIQRELIYQSFLVNNKLSTKSTITRKEAKKRLKDELKTRDAEKSSDQDELRREFVRAMFKK